jgi:DNA repair protein RadB
MISSGNVDFDSFLGQGFEKKLISLVYGPAASGKTTLCLQAALNVAKNGRVLFVDSENGFSTERLKQMNPSCDSILSNIVVLRARNYEEQMKIFGKLNEIMRAGSFNLLIIDTIGIHYRKALRDLDYNYVNEKMIGSLRMLKHLAEDYDVPILMTNQVYTNMKGENVSVGGNMLKNFGKYLVEFKVEPRRAVMLKPKEKIFHFDIDDKGIKKLS